MELRAIRFAESAAGMTGDLWYAPVQIRRRRTADTRNGWSEFGPVLTLGRAVRDALTMLESETVTIHFVHPSNVHGKIGEIDILRLSRHADYPFRDIAR